MFELFFEFNLYVLISLFDSVSTNASHVALASFIVSEWFFRNVCLSMHDISVEKMQQLLYIKDKDFEKNFSDTGGHVHFEKIYLFKVLEKGFSAFFQIL
jgi:hypothetical protein